MGGTENGYCSRVNISELTLNYGARAVLDVNGQGDADHDWLNATTLNIDDTKKDVDAWKNYGPLFITPVFKIRMQTTLGEGRYPIGNVTTVNGDLSAIVLESDLIGADHLSLEHEDGVLYLRVSDVATANDATIAITDMVPYENVATHYPSASPDNYSRPVVSITGYNTAGMAPVLSGTFERGNHIVAEADVDLIRDTGEVAEGFAVHGSEFMAHQEDSAPVVKGPRDRHADPALRRRLRGRNWYAESIPRQG